MKKKSKREEVWEEVHVMYKNDDDFPVIEAVASMRCPNCKRYTHQIYLYGCPTEMCLFCSFCGKEMV